MNDTENTLITTYNYDADISPSYFLYLIQKHTTKSAKWLNYCNTQISVQVKNFLNSLNHKEKITKFHFVLIFIYFKRLIYLGGVTFDPFHLFVISVIFCFKFWFETNSMCIKLLVYFTKLLNYEIKIMSKTKFEFLISENLFWETFQLMVEMSD